MNRQQFLAELNQYLTFFSPEEKARIISAYNNKFDCAGTGGESMLLTLLGSPMKNAIELKRCIESGEEICFDDPIRTILGEKASEFNKTAEADDSVSEDAETTSDETVSELENAIDGEDDSSLTSETEPLTSENDEKDVPDTAIETQKESEFDADFEEVSAAIEKSISEESKPKQESSEVKADTVTSESEPNEPISQADSSDDAAVSESAASSASPKNESIKWNLPEKKPSPVSEKSDESIEPEKKSGAKLVFSILGASIVSIIIAALSLVVAALGGGLFVVMWYLVLTGFKTLFYTADALLLFGGGLVCAGLGLLIVWFAVWTAIKLISGLFRSACRA